MDTIYCPECGVIQHTVVIETTQPDDGGEYKIICSCEYCDNLFYIVRGLDGTDVEDKCQ